MGQNRNDIQEDMYQEAVTAIKCIAYDTAVLMVLLISIKGLEFFIDILGYHSEYWAYFLHTYADPIVILTMFSLSSVRLISIVVLPLKGFIKKLLGDQNAEKQEYGDQDSGLSMGSDNVGD